MDKRTSRLDEFIANPNKSLWKLAMPIMAGMGLQTLYTIVDMIFIGRLGGEAIAAVAFNMPLFFFVMGLTFGLGSGVTASIARFIGADDKVNADNSAEHAVLLSLLISISLSTILLLFGKTILQKIGATESLIDMSWTYLKVTTFGMLFMVCSTFFRSILIGEGDTKTPMVIEATGTVLNIILDPIFIFILNLGVAGAAWATIISQCIVFIIYLYVLFVREHTYVKFNLRDFTYSSFILKEIINVGVPASMSMIIMSVGQLVFNIILVNFSTEAVAAYQVGGRIDMFVLLPIMSIASGLTTMVGMFYGAKSIDKLKAIITYGLKSSFTIAAISSVVIFLSAPLIVKVFSDVPYIQNTATTYLRLMALVYPLVAVALPSSRILQGFGLGMPILIITGIRVLIVSSPLALFFIYILHKPLVWVWYAMMISAGISFIVAISWVRWAVNKYAVDQQVVK